MTYLVVGFPRSGTSMAMRALDAGGIPAVYDRTRDDAVRGVATLTPGYDPNPHGYFEVDDPRGLDWRAMAGRCVKVVRENLPDCVPAGRYRAVYLTRDPAEIRRSLPAVMGGVLSPADLRALGTYAGAVAADLRRLADLGADVTVLHYPDVIAEPVREFGRLAAAGWPLDVGAAAATVDPALYRHRGA